MKNASPNISNLFSIRKINFAIIISASFHQYPLNVPTTSKSDSNQFEWHGFTGKYPVLSVPINLRL